MYTLTCMHAHFHCTHTHATHAHTTYAYTHTHTHTHTQNRVGRPTEGPMLGVVDPKCTVMAFHLYAGILKVVPLMLDSGEQLKAFDCRLDDLYAIDMQFLHGYEHPSIAYLAEVSDLI